MAIGVDCNFTPTCSRYAAEAIERHGAWKGLGLALARLRRCRNRDQVGRLADPVP
ncbi:MAG: membrane protein insertion efficiency factor YidD [Alphaproteobacteria bacterium]|nr:membrane protein insertion efficiency factor YidD [Alphaproteobacteria bacterium]